MDIPGLSTIMSTGYTQGKVGMAVLDKALDMNEVLGAQMVEMIDAAALERSVNPNVGGNFDIRV